MTDWNERYRKGETPWEKGAPAPPLLELLGKVDAEIWGDGSVLVPGCGTGHDVRALAAKGFPVLGLDLAEEAICRAHSHPEVGGESYEVGDFLDAGWRVGKCFSAIFEHTCFCAIDPARRADYANLQAFYFKLAERAPYIGLEQFSLATVPSRPQELEAVFRITSVEALR
jgi:SAM-dependent methyltransferase